MRISENNTQQQHAVGALLTHVVVSRDGHGGSGAGALLGEVVAEFEDAGVVLQHGGDLHLNRVSKLLPLQQTGSSVRRKWSPPRYIKSGDLLWR